jgi:hypothetical protein
MLLARVELLDRFSGPLVEWFLAIRGEYQKPLRGKYEQEGTVTLVEVKVGLKPGDGFFASPHRLRQDGCPLGWGAGSKLGGHSSEGYGLKKCHHYDVIAHPY